MLFLCLFFIFMRPGKEAGHHLVQREDGYIKYPTIFLSKNIPLHQEVVIIIGEEEVLSQKKSIGSTNPSICAWLGGRYHTSNNIITSSSSAGGIHNHLGLIVGRERSYKSSKGVVMRNCMSITIFVRSIC